jgi:hypothetical protein
MGCWRVLRCLDVETTGLLPLTPVGDFSSVHIVCGDRFNKLKLASLLV